MTGRQRGAAILTAMLTVVLVATLAAGMLWQQWRGVEVESAQRARVQAAWVLSGALDWARLILREDARDSASDHLAEPWAVPLAPARLSTFLAADKGVAQVGDDADRVDQVFLSGQIDDLQARLNVTNLTRANQVDARSLAAWQRLFKLLNLPPDELTALTDALLRAGRGPTNESTAPDTPLRPQTVGDLRWLGLSPDRLRQLAPFITLLPVRTPINLNTASTEVLHASVAGLDLAQARALVQARALQPMATAADFDRVVNNPALRFEAGVHAFSSGYFRVTGQLRQGQYTLQETSVLQRNGLSVQVLSRVREVITPGGSTLK